MDPARVREIELEETSKLKQNKRDLKKSTEAGFGRMSASQVEKLENFFGSFLSLSLSLSLSPLPLITCDIDGPNFLVKVTEYLTARLKTCATSCIICDAPLGYMGVKPTVCPSILCTHSFDAYGLGFSLTSELGMCIRLITVGLANTFTHRSSLFLFAT